MTDGTNGTDRTKGTAMGLFNLLMFNLLTFAATAATCTPATTNDYYYTMPKTTNIFGRVMGERGDYRLVRNEDIAWINEAWAERYALANGLTNVTVVAGGPLVSGHGRPVSMNNYWEKAALTSCVVTNTGSWEGMLYEASEGKMTNITCSITNFAPNRLVSAGLLTNAYATLKKMNCLVIGATPEFTNEVKSVYQQDALSSQTGQPDVPWSNTTTSSVSFSTMIAYGAGETLSGYIFAGTHYTDRRKFREQTEGSGKLQLLVYVPDTNAWLRGESYPKVVRGARAYARMHLLWTAQSYAVKYPEEGGSEVIRNDSWREDKQLLFDMGEATFAETRATAGGDRLVYEVDYDNQRLLAASAQVVDGVPSPQSCLSKCAYPSVSGFGEAIESSQLEVTIEGIILVFDMKPVTWIDGW